MSALTVQSPFPLFTDVDGQPLEQGQVWLGTAGNNPLTSPITAYWDEALTQVVTQPVTTRGGYPLNGSSIGRLYVPSNYSILVRNRNGYDVLSSLTAAYPYDSSLITFLQAGAGAVVRSVQAKLRDVISVKDFGAVGDGVADDTAAIQAAINAGNSIWFPAGTYRLENKVSLKSNLVLEFDGNAKLMIQSGETGIKLEANTASNIVIRGLYMEGAGDANPGDFTTVHFVNCSNVLLDNCTFIKLNMTACVFDNCLFTKVQNCNFSQNYIYAVEDRNCANSKYTNNLFYLNGNTGTNTSVFGRGLVLWKTSDSWVDGNRFVGNTEYGLRYYSQTGDTTENENGRVVGNFFRDNGVSDFYIYNESGRQNHILVADNIVERGVASSFPLPFIALGGKRLKVNNCIVRLDADSGTLTGTAFGMYDVQDSQITNCMSSRISACFNISESAPGGSKNILVDNFVGLDCHLVATAFSSEGIKITNGRFTCSNSAIANAALTFGATPGKNWVENCQFHNFNIAVRFGNSPIALFRNTSTSSADKGLLKDGADIANQEFGLNSWDSTFPDELDAMQKVDSGIYSRATLTYPTAPTTLSYVVGDRTFKSNPSAGQPKSWVCTVAGTPGTWTSEGNL